MQANQIEKYSKHGSKLQTQEYQKVNFGDVNNFLIDWKSKMVLESNKWHESLAQSSENVEQ